MKWEELTVAPIVLVKSEEPVFADRAIDKLKNELRELDPNTEFTTLDVSQYHTGELAALTSPSLFGEPRSIIVPALESTNATFQEELEAYSRETEPDVCLILRHNGGARGKKVLDFLAKVKVPCAEIPKVKSASDKARAVTDEARRSGRKLTTDAVGALVDALGSDVRELLAATSQLLADVEGTIQAEHVHTYFAGRIEATGFNVADALTAGHTGRAVELARHAMATGTSPVAIVSAIAMKLRAMAQVLGARSSKLGVQPQMASWQADRAKKDLRHWSAEAIGRSIELIARADAEVKGQSRDPQYAVERGIVDIGRTRQKR